MKVFRVENHKGHGPVFGPKSTYNEYYDYRNNEKYIESYKKLFSERGQEFNEEDLYGYNEITIHYDSKEVIRKHPTPRENKPYFYNRFNGTFGYYRFGEDYSFGWKTFKQCLDFVDKGKKKKWILHKEGFYISEYETNDKIIFPDGQIAFKLKKAKLVKIHKNVFC